MGLLRQMVRGPIGTSYRGDPLYVGGIQHRQHFDTRRRETTFFMADNSSHPNHLSSRQSINIQSTIHTPTPKVGGSSQSGLELAYELTCEQL